MIISDARNEYLEYRDGESAEYKFISQSWKNQTKWQPRKTKTRETTNKNNKQR